jgi:MoxR-like ATPase
MTETLQPLSPLVLENIKHDIDRAKCALHQVIVGQTQVIDAVFVALLSRGHVLLEGVPGVGKTLLVRTLGHALGLKTARIQFTPDLMPADILGTTIVVEDPISHFRRLEFRPGPLFANLVLADEINRATPKTQSALLEAMQEQTVTTLDKTHPLDSPFFVLATQNPIEMEGTYPLPEAQLDRFFMKIMVPFPTATELSQILDTKVELTKVPFPEPAIMRDRILEMQSLVTHIPVADHVREYVVSLVRATHPELNSPSPNVRRFVRLGVSPRGAQALLLAAKVHACLRGELVCSLKDVQTMATATLQHRLQLSFEGQADNVSPSSLIDELLSLVPEHESS